MYLILGYLKLALKKYLILFKESLEFFLLKHDCYAFLSRIKNQILYHFFEYIEEFGIFIKSVPSCRKFFDTSEKNWLFYFSLSFFLFLANYFF